MKVAVTVAQVFNLFKFPHKDRETKWQNQKLMDNIYNMTICQGLSMDLKIQMGGDKHPWSQELCVPGAVQEEAERNRGMSDRPENREVPNSRQMVPGKHDAPISEQLLRLTKVLSSAVG